MQDKSKNTEIPQCVQPAVSGSVDEFDYLCGKCKIYQTNNLDNLFDHRQLCKIKINKIKNYGIN